jgi:parallel beta-helix repeat protein
MDCKLSVKASPNVIIVPDDYERIQWAIGNASMGDTIYVRAGTYYENVTVNKSVFLVGEDRDSTIVDGNETGSVISITADNVSIEGFTIKRSGSSSYNSGIFVDRSDGNDISRNTITNNNYGINLYYSSDNLISGNTITDNNDGVSLYSSISNEVSDNNVTDNYDGIIFYYSTLNVVSCNTIIENHYGVLLYDSSRNVVFHNNFVSNTQQTYSYNSINDWDNANEGNYWSGYTGVDLYSGPYQNETGRDGIGDIPYARDNYPLAGMFYDFKATLERETYHVPTICNSTISEFRFEIGPETGNKIIRFNATGKDGTVGFCRVAIPTELMSYPYIVLVGAEEINATKLDVSNETYVYLYLNYRHNSYTIAIISSKTLHLYNKLLDKYVDLNATYHDLLNDYSVLLGNYSQLQDRYGELNNSYQKHVSDYSKNVHNIQNLMYIFAATTAIFIITTIYLSKHAHAGKTKVFEGTQKIARSNVHTTMKHLRATPYS